MTNHQIDVRTPWHQTTQGCWSLTLAGGGYVVRVTQRKTGQTFQRIMLDVAGKQHWASLGTTEQGEAEQLARDFLCALLTMQEDAASAAAPLATGAKESQPMYAEPAALSPTTAVIYSQPEAMPLTLGKLITLYLESAAYQKLDDSTKTCYQSCTQVLRASIGADFDVTRLDADVIQAHKTRRERGGIIYERTRMTKVGERTTVVTTPAVRTRTVSADLQVLRIMLYWATETRNPKTGRWLLQEFPVRGGIAVEQEKNKVRAFATFERFEQVMNAIRRLRREVALAQDASALRRLQFVELALVLVEATGRRIESVSLLHGDDFTLNAEDDFRNARIRWRPENDKKRHGQDYPLPQSVARRVHALLEEREILDGHPCFPKVRDAMRSVSPDELTVWFRELEASIGLEKLPQGVWHPYRRKWSKERKHLPPKDVMEAGGWKDIKTFMDSYNEPDMETMRNVAEDPERRRLAAQESSDEPFARHAVSGQRGSLGRHRPVTAAGEARVLPFTRGR